MTEQQSLGLIVLLNLRDGQRPRNDQERDAALAALAWLQEQLREAKEL